MNVKSGVKYALRHWKQLVLAFVCTKCGEVFLASTDECAETVIMGVPIYQVRCPSCCQWVTGKDTGVTADQKAELETLEKDILKEIQTEESLSEDTYV